MVLASQSKVTVRATADPLVAKVAQPIEFRVIVEAPTPTPIQFPDLPDELGKLEIVGSSDVTLQRSETQNVWQKTWTLQSLRSGVQTIPSIDVRAGESSVHSTEPIDVEIQSSLPDERRVGPVDPAWIGPLEPPHEIDEASTTSRNWIVPVLMVAAMALLSLLVWRRNRLRQSPQSRMLQQLDELLIQTDESPAEGALGLLDAWRRYLSAVWNLPTAGMTASELVDAAQSQWDDSMKIDVIRDSAVAADRIAYAGEPATREKVIKLIERSRHWVQTHRSLTGSR